jgi:pyruvate kinase
MCPAPVRYDVEFEVLLEEAAQYACTSGLCQYGDELVVVHGAQEADADTNPMHCLKARMCA